MIDPLGGATTPYFDANPTIKDAVRLSRSDLPRLFYAGGSAYSVPSTPNAIDAIHLQSITSPLGGRVRTNNGSRFNARGEYAARSWANAKDFVLKFWCTDSVEMELVTKWFGPLAAGNSILTHVDTHSVVRNYVGKPAGTKVEEVPGGHYDVTAYFTATDPIGYGSIDSRTKSVGPNVSGGSDSPKFGPSNQGTTPAPWWIEFHGDPVGEIVVRVMNNEDLDEPAPDQYITITSKDSTAPLYPLMNVGQMEVEVWEMTQAAAADVTIHVRDAWA